MKKMKIKNKILVANILTVVCAVLTLLSFSAMQGFSFATLVAICVGIYFAKATLSFVRVENILRRKTNSIKFKQVVCYQQNKSVKAA